MVGACDFICDIYMCTHPLYIHVKYLTYMSTLVGLFISGTYLAITGEIVVKVAVGCVFGKDMQKCWVNMPMYHICHMSYTWNVAAIFVQ